MNEIVNTLIKFIKAFTKNKPTKRIFNKLKKEVELYKVSFTKESVNLYISCAYVSLFQEYGLDLLNEEIFINLYNELCEDYVPLSLILSVYKSLIQPFGAQHVETCLSDIKKELNGKNTYSLYLLFTQLYNSCIKRFHLSNSNITNECQDILNYFNNDIGMEFFVSQSQHFSSQPFSIRN